MFYIIASPQSGVGKTTLATHVTQTLAQQGSTILIDAESQQEAYQWSQRYTRDFAYEHFIFDPQDHHRLSKRIQQLKQHYAHVILDISAQDHPAFRSVLFLADKLIVPTHPTTPDVAALKDMAHLMVAVKQYNPELKAYLVINKAPLTDTTALNEIKTLLRQVPDVKLLEMVLRDRQEYRDTLSDGHTVLQLVKHPAKDDFIALMAEILDDQFVS